MFIGLCALCFVLCALCFVLCALCFVLRLDLSSWTLGSSFLDLSFTAKRFRLRAQGCRALAATLGDSVAIINRNAVASVAPALWLMRYLVTFTFYATALRLLSSSQGSRSGNPGL